MDGFLGIMTTEGAFHSGNASAGNASQWSGDHSLYLDASTYNSTYTVNGTVKPNSLAFNYIIHV